MTSLPNNAALNVVKDLIACSVQQVSDVMMVMMLMMMMMMLMLMVVVALVVAGFVCYVQKLSGVQVYVPDGDFCHYRLVITISRMMMAVGVVSRITMHEHWNTSKFLLPVFSVVRSLLF